MATRRITPSLISRIVPWLEVLAIGSWGLLLMKLWLFGQLYLLVHPNYIWMTALTGFALLGVSGLEAWRVAQRRRYPISTPASAQHTTLLKPHLSSLLLLATAIVGLAINPRPFASDTAVHRGVTDSLTSSRSVPQSFRASNRPEERTLVEWARTLNVYPEPDAYTGQKVKVQGFAVHPKDLPEQIFLISRFVITCCAADVYPVSLPVKVSQSRSNYPADKWFQVEGQMITEEINGKRQLAIAANNITPIAEPKNPYEY